MKDASDVNNDVKLTIIQKIQVFADSFGIDFGSIVSDKDQITHSKAGIYADPFLLNVITAVIKNLVNEEKSLCETEINAEAPDWERINSAVVLSIKTAVGNVVNQRRRQKPCDGKVGASDGMSFSFFAFTDKGPIKSFFDRPPRVLTIHTVSDEFTEFRNFISVENAIYLLAVVESVGENQPVLLDDAIYLLDYCKRNCQEILAKFVPCLNKWKVSTDKNRLDKIINSFNKVNNDEEMTNKDDDSDDGSDEGAFYSTKSTRLLFSY